MTDPRLTPPSELVKKWKDDWFHCRENAGALLIKSAQWGDDQSLQISLEWLVLNGYGEAASRLSAARRPQPPSLKEQALSELDNAVMRGDCITVSNALPTIRAALESLPQ